MDILTIIGLVLGFGGTLGAVLVNYPMNVFVLAIKNARLALFQRMGDPYGTIKLIAELSAVARKDGLLALESSIKKVQDPFLRKGLQLVVDGAEPKLTRDILEIDIAHTEEYNLASAKVFESAGGYAPTIGIIGAVLGLIHVMENLSDPSKLGAGIAVAFVATVYGVASANLVYLPVAGKIKMKIREQVIMQEMAVEGLISLSEGENPRRVEEKLVGFLRESQRK